MHWSRIFEQTTATTSNGNRSRYILAHRSTAFSHWNVYASSIVSNERSLSDNDEYRKIHEYCVIKKTASARKSALSNTIQIYKTSKVQLVERERIYIFSITEMTTFAPLFPFNKLFKILWLWCRCKFWPCFFIVFPFWIILFCIYISNSTHFFWFFFVSAREYTLCAYCAINFSTPLQTICSQ